MTLIVLFRSFVARQDHWSYIHILRKGPDPLMLTQVLSVDSDHSIRIYVNLVRSRMRDFNLIFVSEYIERFGSKLKD